MSKRPAAKLVELLQAKQLTLALAESMTCGLMAHKLSNVIGTSDVLKGGIVCYHPEVKRQLCHVPARLLKSCTPESQEVTDELARNLSKQFDADIYLAITGLAAPGGSESPQKPVGTVFISIFFKGKIFQKRLLIKGSPLEIKKKACKAAFRFLISILKVV